MAHTEFVEVYRVEHGDYMFIPKQVQEKYQDKFVLREEEEVVEEVVEEEEEVVEEVVEEEEVVVEEVKPKRGRRAK